MSEQNEQSQSFEQSMARLEQIVRAMGVVMYPWRSP